MRQQLKNLLTLWVYLSYGLRSRCRLFDLFAGPKQGVTRNIVLDKKGEIIFLTRLYERAEFEEMILVIDQELKKQ